MYTSGAHRRFGKFRGTLRASEDISNGETGQLRLYLPRSFPTFQSTLAYPIYDVVDVGTPGTKSQ